MHMGYFDPLVFKVMLGSCGAHVSKMAEERKGIIDHMGVIDHMGYL